MNSLRQPTSLLLDSSSFSSSYTATSVSRLGTSPPGEHHSNTDQHSRDYFIAALSLYGETYIFAFFRTAIQSLKAEAKFTLLPDSTIRISIPSKMSWKPGQHVFLRFWALPGLHPYSMHPFTICSLPSSGEMVFFVRPHRGFTGRLKKLVETRYGTMAMSIDGPYGNRGTASKLASSDKVHLIAGSSGT